MQTKLQELRKNLVGAKDDEKKNPNKSGISLVFLLLGIGVVVGGFFIYKNRKILTK